MRPAKCLGCGREAAVPGRPLGLHGHGTRSRLQLGPPDLFEPPELTAIRVRRYQCQRCGAITMVAPADVLAALRYRTRAVVAALAYLAEGRASPWIRERLCPDRVLGHDGRRSWRSPARWTVRAEELWPIRAGPAGTPRDKALAAVRQLAAWAPAPSGRLLEDAVAGALAGGPHA